MFFSSTQARNWLRKSERSRHRSFSINETKASLSSCLDTDTFSHQGGLAKWWCKANEAVLKTRFLFFCLPYANSISWWRMGTPHMIHVFLGLQMWNLNEWFFFFIYIGSSSIGFRNLRSKDNGRSIIWPLRAELPSQMWTNIAQIVYFLLDSAKHEWR